MRTAKTTLIFALLICAGLVPVCSARSASSRTKRRQPSAWELLGKRRREQVQAAAGGDKRRRPGQADAPDLSTPSTAVYSVLSLIEQDATDKLVSCFVNDTEYPKSNLCPRYLGHPIELVEANEEGESAEVIWKATVHTEFSLYGKSGFPGDTITLRTSLVRAEDVWKILRLFDGVQDGLQ